MAKYQKTLSTYFATNLIKTSQRRFLAWFLSDKQRAGLVPGQAIFMISMITEHFSEKKLACKLILSEARVHAWYEVFELVLSMRAGLILDFAHHCLGGASVQAELD